MSIHYINTDISRVYIYIYIHTSLSLSLYLSLSIYIYIYMCVYMYIYIYIYIYIVQTALLDHRRWMQRAAGCLQSARGLRGRVSTARNSRAAPVDVGSRPRRSARVSGSPSLASLKALGVRGRLPDQGRRRLAESDTLLQHTAFGYQTLLFKCDSYYKTKCYVVNSNPKMLKTPKLCFCQVSSPRSEGRLPDDPAPLPTGTLQPSLIEWRCGFGRLHQQFLAQDKGGPSKGGFLNNP